MMNDLNTLVSSEENGPETEFTYGKDELSETKTVQITFTKFFQKTKSVLSHVTVEPCVLLYLISFAIQSTLITNMILRKACDVHFQFDDETCANLTAHPEENKQVQTYTSQLGLYMSLIESLPLLFFIVLLGSWSDKHGRKLPMVFPLVGNFISVIILMVNSAKWDLPPEYILLASIPKALTGGFVSLLMICYAYISDISSEKDRTMRVALLDASFALGPILGLSLGGVMFIRLGFVGAFGLSLFATALCVVYILAVIKETIVNDGSQCLEEDDATASPKRYLIVEAFSTAVKPRQNYTRAKLLTMMAALSLMVSVYEYGGLEFLFVKKKFEWGYGTYIKWLLFQTIITATVTFIVLPVALYKWKTSDILLGIVGSISRISCLLTLAFSPTAFFLYLSAIAGCLGYLPIIVARAVISKLVHTDEMGKIFSLVACLEVVIPLGSKTIFTVVYNATLNVFPGTIFLLGAGIFCVVTILFVSVYVMDKRTEWKSTE